MTGVQTCALPISGVTGAHFTTFFRENDTRLLRWWSTDPKPSAGWSPYVSMQANPIWFNDVLGDTVKTEGFSEKKIVKDLGKGLDVKKDKIGRAHV